jgi:hypothetical protein
MSSDMRDGAKDPDIASLIRAAAAALSEAVVVANYHCEPPVARMRAQ